MLILLLCLSFLAMWFGLNALLDGFRDADGFIALGGMVILLSGLYVFIFAITTAVTK